MRMLFAAHLSLLLALNGRADRLPSCPRWVAFLPRVLLSGAAVHDP